MVPNFALSGSTIARNTRNPPTTSTTTRIPSVMAAHFRIRRRIAAMVLMGWSRYLAASQGLQKGEQPLLVLIGQIGAIEMPAITVAGGGRVVERAETLSRSACLAGEPAALRIDQIVAAVEFLRPTGGRRQQIAERRDGAVVQIGA